MRELKRGELSKAAHSLEEGRQDLPRSAAVRYDQGIAFRRLGLVDSARTAFDDATRLRGDEARSAAAYNLGNGALRQNQLDEAIARYRASLRADHARLDAKKNLEEAIRRARRAQPPPPSAGGGGGAGRSGSGQGKGGGGGPDPPDGGDAPEPEPPGPQLGGPIPSRAEAELWLEALEAERRSERTRERRPESGGSRHARDW